MGCARANSTLCEPSYSFDNDEAWWERLAYPQGTKWANTLAEVEADLRHRLISGSCCCFRKIYLTQHNGVPGNLQLGDRSVSTTILNQLNAEADLGRRKVREESLQREEVFLRFVSKFMCPGGKIVFVQCESGARPEGDALREWIGGILGPKADFQLFEEGVRWFYGTPLQCKSSTP
jgi:hypothetical protein